MTIFDSICREVKPSRTFGRGLVRSLPTHRAPFTASDVAWLVAERAAAEDRHHDQLAGEAEAMARHERGLCC